MSVPRKTLSGPALPLRPPVGLHAWLTAAALCAAMPMAQAQMPASCRSPG